MKSDSTSTSDFEQMMGKAAVEASRMSSQVAHAAKKIWGEMTSEMGEAKGFDIPAIDLIETDEELIAIIALPGALKEKIDLRVTDDSLYIDAKATTREGRYLKREMSPLGMRREMKVPLEIKPEQVKASFENGILEVHLPKLVVINAQKVQVD